jgi:hypothetical protein
MPEQDALVCRAIDSGCDAGELTFADTGVTGRDTDDRFWSWLCVGE